MTDYRTRLLSGAATMLERHQLRRGQLAAVNVAHDSWCKLLNGKGKCNCSPEITISSDGTKTDR